MRWLRFTSRWFTINLSLARILTSDGQKHLHGTSVRAGQGSVLSSIVKLDHHHALIKTQLEAQTPPSCPVPFGIHRSLPHLRKCSLGGGKDNLFSASGILCVCGILCILVCLGYLKSEL